MSIKEHNKYQTSKIVKEMSGVDHTSCNGCPLDDIEGGTLQWQLQLQ